MPSNTPPNQRSSHHPTTLEHGLAVAIVLWVMLAGVCVVMANAWAAGLLD